MQRRSTVLGVAGLLVCTLAFAAVLVAAIDPSMPMLMLILVVGLTGAGMIWRHPALSVYIFVFAALTFEQWPVVGIDPITAQTRFFQTLSGAGFPLPLPVSPAEMLLIMSLVAVILPPLARRGSPFHTGTLFGPMMFFLAMVLAAFAYGFVRGAAGTSYSPNAAWAESRSFVYLVIAYFLACNLIVDRKRLVAFVWIIIGALSFKGVQGMYSFYKEQRLGLKLETITGHEDVVFFATFFLLLAGLLLYGRRGRQRTVMLVFLPPLIFTDLATSRRIAFLALAAGLLLVGLALWRTRRRLFFRIAPVVLVLVTVYTGLFWNHTDGMLGQPARAFKSQFGETTERDRQSDLWRDLEDRNVAFNIKSASVTGLGFGRPYRFYIEQPSLDSTGFVYWHYITHNAIFWVWMKMGAIGFIAFWFLLGSAIVKGLVTLRTVRDGYLKAVALTIVSLVVMQIFFSFGDLGLTYARSMIYLGCMLGVLVRLPAMDGAAAPELSEPASDCPPTRRVQQVTYREELSTT